jgi:hypothetical protein
MLQAQNILFYNATWFFEYKTVYCIQISHRNTGTKQNRRKTLRIRGKDKEK